MKADPARIVLRNVRKSFGAKQVLNGVDLTIAPGESVVVIGGSGSGKSVLLKCILGLIKPDSGSILIDGIETVAFRDAPRTALLSRMGMLFQGGALFDSLSVWENIAFRHLQDRSLSKTAARALAIGKLSDVGLSEEVSTLMPSELSGGMQKRVALARAIASDPEFLFFDEPTTGLDPIMADVINDLIVQSVVRLNASAISITHDMASARKIGRRVAMLHHGRIIWQGPADTITSSGNPYVDQFVHGRASGPIEMPLRRS